MTLHPQITQAEVEALLEELAQFCRRAGAPRCYQNWAPEPLRDYIAFHAAHGSFAYVRTAGHTRPGPLAGTAVAWQTTESHIRACAAAGNAVFDWQPGNPRGDSVFVADIVCAAPGALEALLAWFLTRNPRWPRLKWFSYRRGRLTRLNLIQIARVLARRKAVKL